MMNLSRHSNKKSKAPFIVAALLVVLIFLIDALLGGSVRGFLREGAARVWNATSSTGSVLFSGDFFSTRRALQKENEALREEVSELKVRAAAFEVLKQENEELRQVVNFATSGVGITASVVSSFSASPYGTFLIGAGTETGIMKGDLVLAGDPQFGGFVVGYIESADTRTSLVKGLFAPGEVTDAIVRDIGISLKGYGGGQARGEAPREAVIEVGDVVTAPNQGGRAIGIVGKVEKDPGGASELVYVHLPISLASIKFLHVVPQ